MWTDQPHPPNSQTHSKLLLSFLLLTLIPSANTQCLVDGCQTCPDNSSIICTQCKPGYYKRTFSGGASSYNACWKTWKLVALLLAAMLLGLCYCLLCYYCYRIGKDPRANPFAQRNYDQPSFKQASVRQPIQAESIYQPRVSRPVVARPVARPVVRQPVVSRPVVRQPVVTRPVLENSRVMREPVRYVAAPGRSVNGRPSG